MGWLYLPLSLLYSYYYNRALGWPLMGSPGQTGFGFDTLLRSYLILGVYFILQQALKPLTAAGVVSIVTGTMRGEERALADVFRSIFGRWNWLRLLALGIVIAVIIFMGALALFLPALFLSLAFSLVTQVMVIEGESIWGSLSRSWSMVLRDLGRVILVFLVMGLLSYFVVGVVSTPATLGAMLLMYLQVDNSIWFMVLSLFSSFLGLAVAPVPIIALTLLYHDLRARREGIDLESRIESML